MNIITNPDSYRGKNPVLTIGIFDGVHLGHQQLINQINKLAREINGESVILTFWPHPRVFFEKENTSLKLLTTLDEKIECLQKTGVDTLIILPFNEELSKMSPFHYIKEILVDKIKAKKIVIGYDHRYGYKGEGDYHYMQKIAPVMGFEVQEIPAFDIDNINVSSTQTRIAIEHGEIEKANKFLTYDYFIEGVVVEGKKLGRELGYPTANIHVLDKLKLIPGNGVYIAEIKLDNELYKGVLSIGTNPTTDIGNRNQTIEMYIFDFNKDIYSKTVRVYFKTKIRETEKFNSIDELKTAIKNDVEKGRRYFNL